MLTVIFVACAVFLLLASYEALRARPAALGQVLRVALLWLLFVLLILYAVGVGRPQGARITNYRGDPGCPIPNPV